MPLCSWLATNVAQFAMSTRVPSGLSTSYHPVNGSPESERQHMSGSHRLNHCPTIDRCEYCERSFSTYQHLSVHQRTCNPAKRGISSLLEETKEFWEAKKRRKVVHTGNHLLGSQARSVEHFYPLDLPPLLTRFVKAGERGFHTVASVLSS